MAIISYSGKNYHGWQIQKNALTIQEVFQNALWKILPEKPEIKGCSRTDTGVHANMYAVNFKVNSDISCKNLVLALNSRLPRDIALNFCNEVPMSFHARYSCVKKEYIYKIWNQKTRNPFLDGYIYHHYYPLNLEILRDTAKEFLGTHDFTAFCTLDKREKKNMIRTVYNFDIFENNDIIEIKVCADGFLYNMVRIMVGTLLKAAQGKIFKEDIKDIIASKCRHRAGPTAPAHGLYLNKVYYCEGIIYEKS